MRDIRIALEQRLTAFAPKSSERVISGITRSGLVATATTTVAHGLLTGDIAAVAACTTAVYNGYKTVLSTPTATTFTYAIASDPGLSGGAATVFALLLNSNLTAFTTTNAFDPLTFGTVTTAETAYENDRYVPTEGVTWQRVTVRQGKPEEFLGPNAFKKYQGQFVVNVFAEENKGPKVAEDRAAALLQLFQKGTSISNGSISVRSQGPYVGLANNDGTWYNVPVWIPWFAYI